MNKTIKRAIVVIAGIGLFAGILRLPRISGAREAARLSECRNHITDLTAKLIREASDSGYITESARRLSGDEPYSWRVHFAQKIPELGFSRTYDFRKPWDSTLNQTIAKRHPEIFLCPAHFDNRSSEGFYRTSYSLVTHVVTTVPERQAEWSRVKNLASSKAIIVESHDAKLVWTEPRDVTLNFDKKTSSFKMQQPVLTSGHSGGSYAGMSDGSVRMLNSKTDSRIIRKILSFDEDD